MAMALWSITWPRSCERFRNHDYSHRYEHYFELSSDISTRDRDGIHKTFSGLMKILFPEGEAQRGRS